MLAQISIALTAGTTVVIAAVAGRPVYVKRALLVGGASSTLQIQDTDGVSRTGVMSMANGQPLVLSESESGDLDGWVATAPGKGVQFVVTGVINGMVGYTQ
jgi:hypothetical protein